MTPQQQEYVVYGSIAAIGLLVLVVVLNRGGSAPAQSTGGSFGIVGDISPQTYQTQVDAMVQEDTTATQAAVAKAQIAATALTSYEQSQNGLTLGLAQTAAATEQAKINATSQDQLAQIQANALVSTSQLAASASTAQAQAQANAIANAAASQQKAVSQSSFWGSLGGILSGVGALFGI